MFNYKEPTGVLQNLVQRECMSVSKLGAFYECSIMSCKKGQWCSRLLDYVSAGGDGGSFHMGRKVTAARRTEPSEC